MTAIKPRLRVIPLLLLCLGAAPEKAGELALVLSSSDPQVRAVASGFRSVYAAPVREINLEGSDKKLREFGEELQAAKPALAVAVGDLAVQMAKWYLPGVPVVYAASPRSGTIFTAADPAVGIYHQSEPGEQLAVLHRLFPERRRVGLFYSRLYTRINPDQIARQASGLGIALQLNDMDSIKEVPKRLREQMPELDLLWVLTDPVVLSPYSIEYIVLQSLTAGVPIFCGDSLLAGSGAAAALVPDPIDVGIKAAQEAEKISRQPSASRGAIIYPKGNLILNNRMGAILKISFPPEALNQAIKVIP